MTVIFIVQAYLCDSMFQYCLCNMGPGSPPGRVDLGPARALRPRHYYHGYPLLTGATCRFGLGPQGQGRTCSWSPHRLRGKLPRGARGLAQAGAAAGPGARPAGTTRAAAGSAAAPAWAAAARTAAAAAAGSATLEAGGGGGPQAAPLASAARRPPQRAQRRHWRGWHAGGGCGAAAGGGGGGSLART